ncbi:hypothetical protein [Nannocystis sp.]|uniref:hypothetical protein n=1 Tax=Nannocystis sp. TaxID=1962667 RepID=UPI0025FC20E5|nr:hypothetical protein [Nannocystis sp.]MBK7828107.1 hypothetical protein [Nannocystis sp.]
MHLPTPGPRLACALATLLACGPAIGPGPETSATTDASTTQTVASTSGASTSDTTNPTTTATPTTDLSTTDAPASTSTSATTDAETGADPLCEGAGMTSLPGVTIEFPPQDCSFTLAEAAAGLGIDFTVTIADPVDKVTPSPGDAGGCEQPGPSGLILFAEVLGNDQHYCICDQGLCPPGGTAITLAAGMYPGTFMWTGENWSGPSDTNNPKGPPFPPGTYELRIVARGQWLPFGEPQPFEVLGTFPITLTP